jgi:hypothetical protein
MRKIIQICAIPCGQTTYGDPMKKYFNSCQVIALCNDNTSWNFEKGKWSKLPDIPQTDYKEKEDANA